MPSVIERNADHIDAEPRQPVQRALIGVPLDDHGVAARQQRRVDEVERLQRAGDDQDVVGVAVDAGVALEFRGEKLAQRTVALRTAGEAIGGQRLALALEHGVDRVDQALDRDLVGIVVAADEAVFRQPGPFRRRRGQSRGQQRREVERCGGHERRLPCSLLVPILCRYAEHLSPVVATPPRAVLPCVMKLARACESG